MGPVRVLVRAAAAAEAARDGAAALVGLGGLFGAAPAAVAAGCEGDRELAECCAGLIGLAPCYGAGQSRARDWYFRRFPT
jgi:hypothetical protein